MVTTTTSASAGTRPQAGPEPEQGGSAANANPDTSNPLASTGTPRPRNKAARLAGEASSGPSVPNQRSFAIAIVMP